MAANPVGAVRLHIKLTNTVDDELVRRVSVLRSMIAADAGTRPTGWDAPIC